MGNKLLNFFVAGVQKGGTTSLFHHLRGHPALSAPLVKELHFFDEESRDWGTPRYEDLHARFSDDDGDRLRFDCTPIYIFWPPSLARIFDYNPHAKLIVLFREPFERAYSHWCMEFARGWETIPFAEAIRAERKRMDQLLPLAQERRVYSYIERGRYGEQVERANMLFPRRQLLFLRSEDFARDCIGTLTRVTEFLEIDPFPEGAHIRANVRSSHNWPGVPNSYDRAFVRSELEEQMASFLNQTGLSWEDNG